MSALQLTVTAAGVFFLTALLTGVWKYQQIMRSEQSQAHPYVDIAHRAALMYSFAALLLAEFTRISLLDETVEFYAALLPVVYFALAIGSYVFQGLRAETDNQFHGASAAIAVFMWTLIVAEIGGFLVLFYGVLSALF